MSAGLLSRIAETLFWTGRYIERADDTARMLDAYIHRMVEDSQEEDAGCRALLAVLGIPAPPDPELDLAGTLHRLAYDTTSPSAIAGAIEAAHRGTRSVREVISSEMWQCLNVTRQALPETRQAAQRLGPSVYLRYVRERSALFFGLADATMSHDDAWRFLLLGQSVERVDMTARLLLARVPAGAFRSSWPVLLRACGAYEAFVRTRGWAADEHRHVAGFLLMDRLFPRSVLHTLATAEQCLAALEPGTAGPTTGSEPRRRIGRLRTSLEYADAELLMPTHLPGLLEDLQRGCVDASEAIAARYFISDQPVAWELGG